MMERIATSEWGRDPTRRAPGGDVGTSERKLATGATDVIDHPAHYKFGSIEVIDAIESWQCGYHDGNIIKYVARFRHEGNPLVDLKKAKWYLDRLIALEEAK